MSRSRLHYRPFGRTRVRDGGGCRLDEGPVVERGVLTTAGPVWDAVVRRAEVIGRLAAKPSVGLAAADLAAAELGVSRRQPRSGRSPRARAATRPGRCTRPAATLRRSPEWCNRSRSTTPVDVIVVDERHRLPIGRPDVTAAIDVPLRGGPGGDAGGAVRDLGRVVLGGRGWSGSPGPSCRRSPGWCRWRSSGRSCRQAGTGTSRSRVTTATSWPVTQPV